MNLFLFLFVGFSITNSLVYLHIFHWLRHLISGMSDVVFYRSVEGKQGRKLETFRQRYLGRLVRCHACMGFWVGASLSLVYGSPIMMIDGQLGKWEGVVGDGLLLSGFNFILWVILSKMGAKDI